jgi:endonuclease/exonuclease/phosphatase family metal-dependent hydrolase
LRWTGNGIHQHEKGNLYYSGSDPQDRNRRNGVAVFVKTEFVPYIKNFVPISDRIILLQLHGQPTNVNIIQVYAPTAEPRYDNDVEDFYESLSSTMKSLKKSDVSLVIGDFNAKVGSGRRSYIIGDYGLGDGNHRGERLYEFCQDMNMVVSNTWFKLPKRRLYTWKSPQDGTVHDVVRNQIDYILVGQRYRNSIKRVTTYPGADINSDHVPLIADITLSLKRIKRPNLTTKIETSKLQTDGIRNKVMQTINNEMRHLPQDQTVEIQTQWNNLKSILTGACETYLKSDKQTKKKKWMTDHILHLMEERRKHKNDKTQYNCLQKKIKCEIKKAKEDWMKSQCEELESYDHDHNAFKLHKKLKEITGTTRKASPSCLVDDSNKIILDEKDILQTWEKYIFDTFKDNRPVTDTFIDLHGPPIIKSEVLHAIRSSENRKACGPDDIPVEVLKLIDDHNIDYLLRLFNSIYDTGNIPQDWLKSTFMTLPKKQHPKKCSDYRLISLMSHILKLFLKIIHARIRNKCEQDLDDTQFGFREAFGTREALMAVNFLLQKCRDQRKEVFACFIDYEKAFDRVKHADLMKMLADCDVDTKDQNFIKNLYWFQTAELRYGSEKSNAITIQRGVRQGCILSPLLFNLYSNYVFKE